MKYSCIFIYFVLIAFQSHSIRGKTNKNVVVDSITDIKDFKKLLRTKTNILICFYNNYKQSQNVIKVFKDVAAVIKGEGTMALIDCTAEAKKMCKKLKIPPDPYILKHYKDGDFNKDYDRKLTVPSMTNFMRDPTGDIPWEEDATAKDVYHLPDANSLHKILKRGTKPILLMFYAPWCGFCKTLKPEYAEAAVELQGEVILAAIDVNRPENTKIRQEYNITGFPTLQYFLHGHMRFQYEGEYKKNAIVAFMRNPQAAPVKVREPEWSDTDSEVVHLTATSFDPVVKEEGSVLVMFYAPWCGHCKRMKPEYEAAAAQMKSEGIGGMLAAVDATKEQAIASRYAVKGYPTIKYFSFGEQKFDVNVREAPKIIEFMREPKEPPPPPPPEKPWSEESSDVVHLTEENFKPFLKKKKHVLVIFYAPWCGHCKRAKPEFTAAAAFFRDDPKVEFGAVDCTQQQALCGMFEVKGYPTMKYFSYYSKNVKTYNGARTVDEFIAFMQNPDKAAVQTSNMSDSDSDEAVWMVDKSVMQLTDESFGKTLKENRVVLVMFYATWCGHCRQMKPQYSDAAKELAAEGHKNVIAMIECNKNPHVADEYEIQGFPTLKLFANGVYVKDYTGKREKNEIKAFLKEALGSAKKKDEL